MQGHWQGRSEMHHMPGRGNQAQEHEKGEGRQRRSLQGVPRIRFQDHRQACCCCSGEKALQPGHFQIFS